MSSHPMKDSVDRSAVDQPKRVLLIVGFLLVVEFTAGILQGYYYPLFGLMIDHWQVRDADMAWFLSVQALAAAVSVPVLSKLGDIFGHRRILRIAILSVTIGTALVAFAPNFGLALVGRALCGPLGVWLPLEIAIIHSRLTKDSSRRAIGFLVGSITLGATLGTLVAGVAYRIPNFSVVLALPVIALVICSVIVFFAVPESTKRANRLIVIESVGPV